MNLNFIIKVSKLCNLRCVYCYEMPELGNQNRMSLEDLGKMFCHVRDFLWAWSQDPKGHRVEFLWHGGEPFAQPLDYWKQVMRLEDEIFGRSFRSQAVVNAVQTNLTLITEKHLPVLRKYFQVGFSFDVFNDYRVDAGGKQTAEQVRRKVDWLLKKGIVLGGIAVISKANVEHSREVAEFYLERGLPFRALHLYEAMDRLPDIATCAVPYDQYIEFFKRLYRDPQIRDALDKGIAVDPLWTAWDKLMRWKRGDASSLREERYGEAEWSFGINTNGDVYSPAEFYNPDFCYGNIFSQSFQEILRSEGRQRRIAQSRERIKKICDNCFLFRRGCLGTYVSHATREEYREYETRGACLYSELALAMREEGRECSSRGQEPAVKT